MFFKIFHGSFSIHHPQYNGYTPLMKACSNPQDPRIVDVLIKADPSPDHLNMKSGSGTTALNLAIGVDSRYYNEEMVLKYYECAALLRAAGADDPTGLCDMCNDLDRSSPAPDMDRVNELIKAGIDIRFKRVKLEEVNA